MRLRPALAVFLWLICSSTAQPQSRLEEHIRSISWAGYQDEAVRLMQEYLRIDTSNPPGNELAAAEFFHKLFDEAGITNSIYISAPRRANIQGVLKGDGTLKPIVLLSHMDVVRADPQNWKAPPFSGEILNGEIYGRGALDMKDEGLLQAMVVVIAAREHLPLKRDVIFLATADEEVGDTGSAWIIQNHPELVKGAEFLITEGGSNLVTSGQNPIYGIGVGEKAPFWIRLSATGRGGHGSIPISDSAPNRLAPAMCRVVNWQTPIRLLPQVDQYFREVAHLEKEPRASQFRNVAKALKNPAFLRWVTENPDLNYMLRDTVSLTVLKGSQQTNVIPDTASCDLDVRLLPGTDPEDFLRQFREVVADPRIEIQPISRYRTPNSSPVNSMLFKIIDQVIHETRPGAMVVPRLNSGYTESQMYRQLGIECYGFNPIELTAELDDTEHAANERVPVEEIRRGVKVLYEVVARAANQ